jgi:hypothetical protein
VRQLMRGKSRALVTASFYAAFFMGGIPTGFGQDQEPTKYAGADNTKMGAYRALAQLSLEAFRKGEMEQAAELSRIFELTWDKGEGLGAESLSKTKPDLFREIDAALNRLIKPILRYSTKPPGAAAVQSAYNEHLAKLKLGDQW